MLKHADGAPMSLQQEHRALVLHCTQLFAPQVEVPNRPGQALVMPIQPADWQAHLKCTPIGKAVPADSAPATAWKACAEVIAPALTDIAQSLQHVSSRLPRAWRDPQLCFIPKPNKPPITASALRPIGLIRPDGKALAGHIKTLVMEQARASLAQSPQYAYLPSRDTTDALARVNECVDRIKSSMKALGGNRFVTRQRKESGQQATEAGGCLLSVDLSQAFDRVNRAKLDAALRGIRWTRIFAPPSQPYTKRRRTKSGTDSNNHRWLPRKASAKVVALRRPYGPFSPHRSCGNSHHQVKFPCSFR